MLKTILRLAATLLCLVLTTNASAGEAMNLVKSKQEQLFKVVAEPKSDEQQTKLNKLFDEMIAYEEFAARSLGDAWQKRTDDEKKRFSSLLTDLIRANYRKSIKKLLDFDIRYDKESTSGPVTAVATLAKHKTKSSEPEIEVDFKLEKVGSSFKVVDIETEKVSMVKNFRKSFLKVLEKDGFEALIAKMQKKLDKLNKKLKKG
ncbi:MAG: ABC transporter substrate-binding protein [Deltaproteobacteria bacterium]|nr:ABC transporter substrate-binding protein [Deltaproteobacteria bacterium]